MAYKWRDGGRRDVPERDHFSGEPPPLTPALPFGPDDDGDGGEVPSRPVGNAVLGMLLFLGTDAMFFAALIGAFIVFKYGALDWPPLGQPRLPVLVTGVNTVILLASGFTMVQAYRRIRRGEVAGLQKYLAVTAGLGTTFLLIQGYEWLKLLRYGLTLSSSVYGATFYTLIGCHALHVAGAVFWLLIVWWRARRGRFTAARHTVVLLCSMYWYLVVLLWPVLYVLVYLN
ncbi:MAG: heme-copper oxidase subunit III [candidate division KSB1 bacterium]|nr:heme-copper oxidase subunit III [candidate division KSB1 bacterium]MDZ7308799.1 heme-copper oxidase subunit III [candidate division KSB1 bacterium]